MSNKQITDIAVSQHDAMVKALQLNEFEKSATHIAASVAGGLIIDLLNDGILAPSPNWEGE